MSDYFSKVPDIEYVNRLPDSSIGDYIRVKNIFTGVSIREDILQDLTVFEKFQIVGDDRPDNVAFEFYGDSNLDWLVLKCNNIINVQSEWPLTQNDFTEYLLDKYGDYNTLYNGIHHYETKEIKNSKDVVIVPEGLQVSKNYKVTYFDSALGQHRSSLIEEKNIATEVTNYDYEINIENKKRNIYLLKSEYVSLVEEDLEKEMKYKKGGSDYISPTLKRANNIKLYQ